MIYVPGFLWHTFRSRRQAMRAPGFAGGRLLLDSRLTFWTLTLWEDEHAMKTFRGSEAHVKVMPRLAGWCDEAAYAHWSQDSDSAPSWQQAYEHLVAEGRLSRVAHPSANHAARRFAPPRLQPLIGENLKPPKDRRRPEAAGSKV
jgi:hypothetical protein